VRCLIHVLGVGLWWGVVASVAAQPVPVPDEGPTEVSRLRWVCERHKLDAGQKQQAETLVYQAQLGSTTRAQGLRILLEKLMSQTDAERTEDHEQRVAELRAEIAKLALGTATEDRFFEGLEQILTSEQKAALPELRRQAHAAPPTTEPSALAGTSNLLRTSPLDPYGRMHIPIGLANTPDSLKTFVEAEGSFSPGVASYGIYFWLWDGRQLVAPTQDGVASDHGLPPEGYLIPWTTWAAGTLRVRTEVCQVAQHTPAGDAQVVAARVQLSNSTEADNPAGARTSAANGSMPTTGPVTSGPSTRLGVTNGSCSAAALYVALRPLGPAGGPVGAIAVSDDNQALLVDGHPALVAEEPVAASNRWSTSSPR